MINKLKILAVMTLAAGATATATKATAAVVDTNTFTNVVQSLSINLTVYSNGPVVSNTKISGEKPVTINNKTIITALENASGTIPTLVGFDFGKAPQLILNTTFASTNILVTNVVSSNTVALATNDGTVSIGTNVLTVSTSTSETISNGTLTGTWSGNTNVTTNSIAYTNSSGATNLTFTTNAADWTVLSAAAGTNGATNLTVVTKGLATNVGYLTNYVGVEVQGGTATAPVYAKLNSYFSTETYSSVILNATGSNFNDIGTTNYTNVTYATSTATEFGGYSIRLFNTNGSTSPANNLDVTVYGLVKAMSKNDVLYASKKAGITNEVPDTTSTATGVSGEGYVGGTFTTNTTTASVGGKVLATSLYASEYFGTNTAGTNAVTGAITNPIPVVVEGSVSLGAPHSVPQ